MATQIPAAPTVPQLGSSSFETDMKAFHQWEKEDLQPNINQIATETEGYRDESLQYRNEAEQFKDDAESAKNVAVSSANYVGEWTSGNNYTTGQSVSHNGLFYRVKADITNSTTSPDQDTTHFELIPISQIRISSGDTTPDYLESKIAAGDYIILTKLNSGENEQLEIKVNASSFANTSLSNVDDTTVLNKIKNVDGSGSGLDADLLDGYEASSFANTSLSNVSDSTVLNKVKNVDGSGSGLDADKWEGGDKIISTADPSGTYPNGSVWFKYE